MVGVHKNKLKPTETQNIKLHSVANKTLSLKDYSKVTEKRREADGTQGGNDVVYSPRPERDENIQYERGMPDFGHPEDPEWVKMQEEMDREEAERER